MLQWGIVIENSASHGTLHCQGPAGHVIPVRGKAEALRGGEQCDLQQLSDIN